MTGVVDRDTQREGERTAAELRDAYLELLKGSLTHTLYGGTGTLVNRPPGLRKLVKRSLVDALARRGMALVRLRPADELRGEGHDWPLFGYTMVGHKRLDNARFCIEDVLANGVPGDLIETGVWRGGTTIFMRGVLKAYGVRDRTVWVADSFRGMPRPSGAYPADAGSRAHLEADVAVPVEEVRENFRRFGLLDDQVRFLEGWFGETLPTVRDRAFAVVRLDGDMYESTIDALDNLYPALSPGGYLIVDDYALAPCRAAVDDFRKQHGIRDEIRAVDWSGVFWRKGVTSKSRKSRA